MNEDKNPIPCWDGKKKHEYQILVDAVIGEGSCSGVCLTQEGEKNVLAETDTDYLVMTEIRYETAQMPIVGGATTTVQNQVYGYSLISKQQFTPQKPSPQKYRTNVSSVVSVKKVGSVYDIFN